jgi:hypothetical protein
MAEIVCTNDFIFFGFEKESCYEKGVIVNLGLGFSSFPACGSFFL